MRALALDDFVDIERVSERFRQAPAAFLPVTVWSVASYSDNLRGAHRLAALMTEPARPEEIRGLGHVWMAVLDGAIERLAVLHDERGELESAAEYNAGLVELWEDAAAALQPCVEAASERIEEIVAERG